MMMMKKKIYNYFSLFFLLSKSSIINKNENLNSLVIQYLNK